jgi:mRNA interferase YafQ
MFDLTYSARFFKDLKRCDKRGLDLQKLEEVICDLRDGIVLDAKYRVHPLQGTYKGYMECHIEFDWLLIYSVDADKNKIRIARTGTHRDLFP